MKEILKVLKLGVKSEDYPYFCQHIHFGKNIRSTNGSVYVEFDENKYPIEGDVNFFVLENVLNNCETPQIEQKDAKLNIKDGDFKSTLIVDKMDFPSHPELDIDFVELNEDFLYIIKSAMKFTGDGLFSYVHINEDYVLSSLNKEKVFYHKHNEDINNVIGINKKILSTLSEGVKLGVLNHNAVIKFNGGKIIFKIALLDNFPSDFIIKIVEEKPECFKLCNVALLQDTVKKVSSILTNERVKKVYLENSDSRLTVRAESAVNGVSSSIVDSELKQEWSGEFYNDFLNNVDLDFDLFVNFNNKNIYLSNERSEIVIVGG